MASPKPHQLSRRERQIMDILPRLGRASPAQVREELPDPPTYTAVNTLLRILGERGHISRIQEGQHYVYFPAQPRQSAARAAVRQLVETFFGGSVEHAVTTMLSEAETDLSEEALTHLAAAVARFQDKETRKNSPNENSHNEGEEQP
jgi:predicted transcriptional regulator